MEREFDRFDTLLQLKTPMMIKQVRDTAKGFYFVAIKMFYQKLKI